MEAQSLEGRRPFSGLNFDPDRKIRNTFPPVLSLFVSASNSSVAPPLDWHLVLQQHAGHELHLPGPQRIRDAGQQVARRHHNTGEPFISDCDKASVVCGPAALSRLFLSDRKTLT